MDKDEIKPMGVTEMNTCIGAKMLQLGEADAMICGTDGHFHDHFDHVVQKLGIMESVKQAAAVNVLLVKQGPLFICDTAVTTDPDAEQIAENTLLAASVVKRFGLAPRAALLSFANGDDIESESTKKMREALEKIRQLDPDLQVEGPIRADAALMTNIRHRVLPYTRLVENANLLIMPSIEAAKIAYDLIKVLTNGTSIGPILVGLNQPVHIMTPSSTVRRIVNASAIATVDAQIKAQESQSLLKAASN